MDKEPARNVVTLAWLLSSFCELCELEESGKHPRKDKRRKRREYYTLLTGCVNISSDYFYFTPNGRCSARAISPGALPDRESGPARSRDRELRHSDLR